MPMMQYVLYTQVTVNEPRYRVMLSGPSYGVPYNTFIKAFKSRQACEDYIRTTYHQRKRLEDILP